MVRLTFSLDLRLEMTSVCFSHTSVHVVDIPDMVQGGSISSSQLLCSAATRRSKYGCSWLSSGQCLLLPEARNQVLTCCYSVCQLRLQHRMGVHCDYGLFAEFLPERKPA